MYAFAATAAEVLPATQWEGFLRLLRKAGGKKINKNSFKLWTCYLFFFFFFFARLHKSSLFVDAPHELHSQHSTSASLSLLCETSEEPSFKESHYLQRRAQDIMRLGVISPACYWAAALVSRCSQLNATGFTLSSLILGFHIQTLGNKTQWSFSPLPPPRPL